MNIRENLIALQKEIPPDIKMVAVSKTKPLADIETLYGCGHKIFGENKVQELTSKYENLPKDIEWHMIGHLQSNKVKYIAPFVSMVHAVDSLKLLKTINKEAQKNNRVIPCLFQLYIAKEESKFGLSFDEIMKIIESESFNSMKHVQISGLMGMATFTDDKDLVRTEFQYLASCFKKLKERHFIDSDNFKELSMGMSGDYKVAIEEGATIIRIGSTIFGERNYHN